MNTINIKLYNILKSDFHLSDERARIFAEAINETVENNISATEFKSSIKEDLLKLELKLTSEIKDTKTELLNKNTDVLKWVIGLFITLALMIIGLYIKLK